MQQYTKITRNNQITIPKSIMKEQNLEIGDLLQVGIAKNGQIVIIPLQVNQTNQIDKKAV